MSDAAAIELRSVTKVYRGQVHALRNVSMRVARGEVFGLLGPNGAGKTTLVKIIMSIVRPTQAQGEVLALPVGSKASLRRVGYLPEHHRFPRYLTGRQTLEFFGGLSGVQREARRRRAEELLESVGMRAWADARVSSYSKGMMQRVGIAAALVNDPELVILDEPTDGVDPVGRRDIRDLLLRMKAEGRTVFINSHLLSELETLSDRVAILVQGQVARQGTIGELTANRQWYEIELALAAPAEGGAALFAALESRGCVRRVALPEHAATPDRVAAPEVPGMSPRGVLPGNESLEVKENLVRVGSTDPRPVQAVIDALRAGGYAIRRVQPVRPSLEELFLEAVGGSAGAHEAGARHRGTRGAA